MALDRQSAADHRLVLQREDVDPLNVVGLLLLTLLIEPEPLTIWQTIFPLALVDHLPICDAGRLSVPFLQAHLVAAFILNVVLETVDAFSMFFSFQKGTRVFACWLCEDSLICEEAFLVELTVVVVDMVWSWLIPPL